MDNLYFRDQLLGLEGHTIPRSQSAGFVVLSYVISYVGSLTTLELINRRTSLKGYKNWFLLLVASVTMGGVAIWSMHIIGNRAIILGQGEPQIQIAYSTGFTILSFFVPIIVLFFAFSTVGINEEISYVRLVVGGTIAGLGVCGMHYLGQASIVNYDCIYAVANVIAAGIIAIVASTVALSVFFVFRSAWSAAWWKRALCASILAVAVTGMHWTASVGTVYRLKIGAPISNPNVRDATIIAVLVLCMGSCVVYLSLIALISLALQIRAASRAQQVVLAVAVFDKEGKILVSPKGQLPSQKITSKYLEQSVNDSFNTAHPTFLWMFRTSRNWSGVKDLIAPMKTHLSRSGLKNRLGAEADANFVNDRGSPIKDYHLILRELFCSAAQDLADEMHEPLDRVGVMYDDIVYTGRGPRISARKKKEAKGVMKNVRTKTLDLERDGGGDDLDNVGRGQLLFLTREVNKQDADRLLAAGYRFADPANVMRILAGTFQVTVKDLTAHLDSMRRFAVEDHILDPGVHLAFFAVKVAMGAGFVILARKDARNQLPTMQLPFDTLEKWHLEYLKNMDGFTVVACLKHLNKTAKSATSSENEKKFASQLQTTLEALKNQVDDSIFNDACLVATPSQAPCRGKTQDSRPGKATIITLKLIVPVGGRAPGAKLDFVPLTFFSMQQHVFKNSIDHAIFARKTYSEFASVLGLPSRASNPEELKASKGFAQPKLRGSQEDALNVPKPTQIKGPNFKDKLFSRRASRVIRIKGDNSSEKNLVGDDSTEPQSLGGIMVSQEVELDSRVDNEPSSPGSKEHSSFEMSELRSHPKSSVSSSASKEEEQETYVDTLFKLCMQTRRMQ